MSVYPAHGRAETPSAARQRPRYVNPVWPEAASVSAFLEPAGGRVRFGAYSARWGRYRRRPRYVNSTRPEVASTPRRLPVVGCLVVGSI
jgi:hypothetical protein